MAASREPPLGISTSTDQSAAMADTSALLDALLQESEGEDEDEQSSGGLNISSSSSLIDLVADHVPNHGASNPSDGPGPVAVANKPRKLSTRQREREEIRRLRGEESELRNRLDRLQLGQGHHHLNGQQAVTAVSRQRRALWMRVAKNQLERRQRAHVENLKLRHMLEHQAKITRSMQTLLRKRSTNSPEHWMSLRKRQCALTDADSITFARLKSDLDARYLETDAVLSESGCADDKTETQRARVKLHATRGLFVEFVDAKAVPFAFHDAGNAMWEGLQTSELPLSDGVYTTVSADGDAVAAKLSIRLSGSRTEVNVDAKFVARKFAETDRVVIVWQCQTDTAGPLCGDHGVRLLNHGWTVIRDASRPAPASLDAPTAIIQSVARVTPELAVDNPRLSSETVGELADLVTASFLRNMNAHHQRTEDILVESLTSMNTRP